VHYKVLPASLSSAALFGVEAEGENKLVVEARTGFDDLDDYSLG
jgi:hypothetical protein